MSKTSDRTQSVKIVLIMLGITLWSLAILTRLVQLQVVRHGQYAESARKKQQNIQSVSAPRGVIYDSHMDILAASVPIKALVAEPIHIEDKPEAARRLASILGTDYRGMLQQMQNPKRKWYYRIGQIDPSLEAPIKDLGIKGLYFVDETTRFYPNVDLASQTLGFINKEGEAGEGVERQYDKVLRGKDGLFSFDIDARQKPYRVSIEKPPVQGNSLVLSIDKSIQYIADKELAAAVKNSKAKTGIAIVMESDTGRILAMSNYPRFNCNTYYNYKPETWKNRAVRDMFEPGSTFKVVVAASALEAGLVRSNELIDCQNGSIELGGHFFRDHTPYGMLTFKQILEHSSNVGAIKLGLKLGQQRLYEALLNFGFGSPTGVDLPGEISGKVRNPKNWSGLSIGAISFGQEVGVTALQILNAINSIANGGYRVRPSVVDRIIDGDENTIWKNSPERTRIMSPRTAETVTEAFEGVVLRGTGKRAALEGYRAAGKTGTAQKSVNGQYPKGVYISSFIGFAPLPNPKISVLVLLDEPKDGYYGGDVCAPYFSNIAQEALLQLRVPPDLDIYPQRWTPPIAENDSKDFIPDTAPVQPITMDHKPTGKDSPDVVTVQIGSEWIVMPDFTGMSKRSVMNRCIDLGIQLKSEGSGIVIYQTPPPGTEIPVGATCRVTFAKADKEEPVAALQSGSSSRQAKSHVSPNSPF